MAKLRVTIDCEHGAAGTELDVDDDRAAAFLAEGRVEEVVPAPVPAEEQPEPEPAAKQAEPVEKENEPATPSRTGHFPARRMMTKAEMVRAETRLPPHHKKKR